MNKIKTTLERHWWPISAMLFCPCHLPLSMGLLVSLTAGTAIGGYISTHYTTIESVLAVTFSFYFVVAFMIWAVRGPQRAEGATCAIDENGQPRATGLSTMQIIGWGLIGMFTMPLMILGSLFIRQDLWGEIVKGSQSMDLANSGLIWLLSISTVVMIPVMIIWIAWMWIAWSKGVPPQAEMEHWQYEYE